MEIEWDHIESFYFVPYLPKKEVSQTGIFLGEQIVKAWGVQIPLNNFASGDGNPRSRVWARETLRSAPILTSGIFQSVLKKKLNISDGSVS